MSAEPVTRCPKCGITVFQSSDSNSAHCSPHRPVSAVPSVYTLARRLVNALTPDEYEAMLVFCTEHTTCEDPVDYIECALRPAFSIGRFSL